MTWIQTYTGRRFDLLNPTLDQVAIEDIAHHLSLANRFCGATHDPYSVSQHSCYVHDLLPDELKLAGLLHDSPEAYLGDWTRPLKIAMRETGLRGPDAIYTVIADVVSEKYGIDLNHLPREVKHADEVMLATERRDLMNHAPNDWETLPEPAGFIVVPWSADVAERAFLARFRECMGVGRG